MTPVDPAIRIWGLIPAAGLSRRMGTPKQTLPYGRSTIVGTLAGTLLSVDLEGVVIVTRTRLVDHLGLPDDTRIDIEINDDDQSEMIDSIRLGLSALERRGAHADPGRPPADGVLIAPGDMPALSVRTCRKCCDAFREDPERIVIAQHGGRQGHPIVFGLTLHTEVNALTGGLNTLAARFPHRVHRVDVDDSGVISDIDTPKQYDQSQ